MVSTLTHGIHELSFMSLNKMSYVDKVHTQLLPHPRY